MGICFIVREQGSLAIKSSTLKWINFSLATKDDGEHINMTTDQWGWRYSWCIGWIYNAAQLNGIDWKTPHPLRLALTSVTDQEKFI